MSRPVGSIYFNERDGRNYIVVLDDSGKEKLPALARFNWEKVHGVVPVGVEVDHIDGDKLNDDVSNLQLLSSLDNLNKSLSDRGYTSKHTEITCKECGEKSLRRTKELRKAIKRGYDGPFCGRKCASANEMKRLWKERRKGVSDKVFNDVFGE